MPHKFDTQLTGAAGEHLVLSRLLSRGFLAAQAPRGTRKADILVNFLEGESHCLIQVKSRQSGSDGGWHMQEKHESQIEEDLFFCFVDFQPEEPVVFVIPSEVVAEAVATDYKIWLETPGMKGQARNETKLRRLKPMMLGKPEGWLEQYRERWDLIQMREGTQA
jgi:hypothetical protein